MRMYYCSHCDTGADETQVGQRRVCPFCERSLKLTSTTLEAYMNKMRERSGERVGIFTVTDDVLEWAQDIADEDGAIHIDQLMDLAHDQEKLDFISWLMSVGLYTDYVFLED
jgi:hypothetical protein